MLIYHRNDLLGYFHSLDLDFHFLRLGRTLLCLRDDGNGRRVERSSEQLVFQRLPLDLLVATALARFGSNDVFDSELETSELKSIRMGNDRVRGLVTMPNVAPRTDTRFKLANKDG